ncbi:MAG: hypothetical protein ACUVTL_03220 [Thermoproteota archaeon]
MSRRIVLIDAGSAMFTRGLVGDLLTQKEYEDWKLSRGYRTSSRCGKTSVAMHDTDVEVFHPLARIYRLKRATQ